MNKEVKAPITIKNTRGAFLVLALFLIIVLSALGIASMANVVSTLRVARNYSGYADASIKATSMAAYAKRILASYTDGKYPDPNTCTSSGTCNVFVSTFPYSGRPTFVWSSGLGTAQLNGNSEPTSWWTTNGFNYEGTFSGSGNARVIVSLVGSESSLPWRKTYKIVGYATDSNGKVNATSPPVYHTRVGYRPDPYPTYRTVPINTCTGGCPYGQCCTSSGTCSSTQSDCESNYGTYTPPGWLCSDYYVTGLGYSSSTCNNAWSNILDVFALSYVTNGQTELQNWYNSHGSWPTDTSYASSFSFDQYITGNNSLQALWWYPCDQSSASSMYAQFNTSVTGQNNVGVVLFTTTPNSDGYFTWQCRRAGGQVLDLNYLPPYCYDVSIAYGVCDCDSCGGVVIGKKDSGGPVAEILASNTLKY